MTKVYIAKVLIGGKLVLDSAWASPGEAQGVIERRARASMARADGESVEILTLPGETSVSWATNYKGRVIPKQDLALDWSEVRHGHFGPDGTITW